MPGGCQGASYRSALGEEEEDQTFTECLSKDFNNPLADLLPGY